MKVMDKISQEYGIDLNSNFLSIKYKWKEYIKSKIREKVISDSEKKKNSMTKLRHQRKHDFCMQEYINNSSITRVGDLLCVKLELLDVGKNHGHEERKCHACKLEAETTEHIISCNKLYEEIQTEPIEWREEMMSNRNHLQKLYHVIKRYIKYRDASGNV